MARIDTTPRPTGHASWHRLARAARTLAAGGIVAHATEGVWGLACDAYDGDAAHRILALKRRDPARGLIVIAADARALAPFVDDGADTAWRQAISSWPSASTWLLPAAATAPDWVTGEHATVALRQTVHANTAALCRVFDGALISTSANVSGRPPVRNAWQARARFGTGVDFVLGGTPDRPGVASTIRDAASGAVLRGG